MSVFASLKIVLSWSKILSAVNIFIMSYSPGNIETHLKSDLSNLSEKVKWVKDHELEVNIYLNSIRMASIF